MMPENTEVSIRVHDAGEHWNGHQGAWCRTTLKWGSGCMIPEDTEVASGCMMLKDWHQSEFLSMLWLEWCSARALLHNNEYPPDELQHMSGNKLYNQLFVCSLSKYILQVMQYKTIKDLRNSCLTDITFSFSNSEMIDSSFCFPSLKSFCVLYSTSISAWNAM